MKACQNVLWFILPNIKALVTIQLSEVNSIYAVDQTVYVDFSANKGEIAIYNILGQEISRTGASNGLNMISVPQGNAVYIVKVISDNTTVTKKVFVK